MGGESDYALRAMQGMANAVHDPDVGKSPEQLLADAFKKDLGVTMDPQALRIFIRWRWDRVQKLAHRIHDGH